MSQNLEEILTEKHDKKNVKEIVNRFEFFTSKMVLKSRDLKHQKQLNIQILGAKIQTICWSTISRSVRRLSNKFHTCTFFAYNALS